MCLLFVPPSYLLKENTEKTPYGLQKPKSSTLQMKDEVTLYCGFNNISIQEYQFSWILLLG